MNKEILPGATLGVLGSGQLGRMFAMAAQRLGYRVHVYSPDSETPAGALADREWTASYDDFGTLEQFARQVDAVTLEFENVSTRALDYLERVVAVRPGSSVLSTAQNRIREKTTLRRHGLPTAEFVAVHDVRELTAALSQMGGSGVLKTASWGYDGKGQRMLHPGDDAEKIWSDFVGQECIFEALVPFACELSVVAARNPQGEIACYDPIVNRHANHILDVSVTPCAEVTDVQAGHAKEIAISVMQSLDVVGVLCVEMFLTESGDLLINEIAPRPHNSGHLTIDAHETSQFEQQVRAMCGLPLGETTQLRPAAMANLLGDVWESGTPHWRELFGRSGVRLHLYGKAEPRAGRKMGHLTCLADDAATAERQVLAAREALKSRAQ